MNSESEFRRWAERLQNKTDAKTGELLLDLHRIEGDLTEIESRFGQALAFGTGGLRGEMGAGTNRLNVLTVRRATLGLAAYLKERFAEPSVCIAYDTRHKSREFAEVTAAAMCACGVKVYLYDGVRPTPMLSFAVRHKLASAGVVITASHNPAAYNGYKVYGPDGGQITDRAAADISECIGRFDVFEGADAPGLAEARHGGLLEMMGEETDEVYFAAVKSLVLRRELVKEYANSLKIVYTPLYGAGNIPVRRVLSELGFNRVTAVAEQTRPDGNFPTAPSPNPEDPLAFSLALDSAQSINPDLILATDPDCDRIGVMIRSDAGDWAVLNGNQTGALLCDYLIRTEKEQGCLPPNSAVIKTIVTSDIGKRICEREGVALAEVLTGFKYIGELAEKWGKSGEHSFLFGFEESFGYLTGDFVRDKDGVIAAVLIAEMALYYKREGKSLCEALEALYARYGYFAEKLMTREMKGSAGKEKTAAIMARLREDYRLVGSEVPVVFEDYQKSVRVLCTEGRTEHVCLPQSDVLKFIFNDSSWLVLRPSGTEPKIKIYLSARGDDKAAAARRLAELEAAAGQILGG